MATTMRLDKYLKVSRLIKRRTVAKEVAEKRSHCGKRSDGETRNQCEIWR